MWKEAKISTSAQVNKRARQMTAKSKGFGKAKADKFGREAKARVNAFAKKVRF